MGQRKNKAPKDQFPYPAKRPTMDNRLKQSGVSGHTDTPENENSKPELFGRCFFPDFGVIFRFNVSFGMFWGE